MFSKSLVIKVVVETSPKMYYWSRKMKNVEHIKIVAVVPSRNFSTARSNRSKSSLSTDRKVAQIFIPLVPGGCYEPSSGAACRRNGRSNGGPIITWHSSNTVQTSLVSTVEHRFLLLRPTFQLSPLPNFFLSVFYIPVRGYTKPSSYLPRRESRSLLRGKRLQASKIGPRYEW